MLISGYGELPAEEKTEAHLRRDQLKLRNVLDRLNTVLNEILEREIKEEKTQLVESQLRKRKQEKSN